MTSGLTNPRSTGHAEEGEGLKAIYFHLYRWPECGQCNRRGPPRLSGLELLKRVVFSSRGPSDSQLALAGSSEIQKEKAVEP